MKLKYVSGSYPMTMQMCCLEYIEEEYKTLFDDYVNKFNLDLNYTYKYNSDDKFYLNFSAFLILDKDNKIILYAFTDFNDLVWILDFININGLEIDINDHVISMITSSFIRFKDRFKKI